MVVGHGRRALGVSHWRGTSGSERRHACTHVIYFMSQHLNLTGHLLMAMLQLNYEVNSFTEDLPFAGFHAAVGGKLVSQFIEEVLHFLPPFPFGQLV